jgi:hypothetical protein
MAERRRFFPVREMHPGRAALTSFWIDYRNLLMPFLDEQFARQTYWILSAGLGSHSTDSTDTFGGSRLAQMTARAAEKYTANCIF